MMYCTKCKIELKETAKFCPRCGGCLVPQTAPTQESRTLQCPQCGKIYGTDHQFCADDGSQLQPKRTPSDALPKPTLIATPPPVLKITLLVLGLLLLAALGIGGYLYYSGRWVDIPMLVKWFKPTEAQKAENTEKIIRQMIRDGQIKADCVKEVGGPTKAVAVEIEDLNNDGVPEYRVMGISMCASSSHGDSIWYYRETSGDLKLIFADNGVNSHDKLDNYTNGYPDLTVTYGATRIEDLSSDVFVFDGNKYKAIKNDAELEKYAQKRFPGFAAKLQKSVENKDIEAVVKLAGYFETSDFKSGDPEVIRHYLQNNVSYLQLWQVLAQTLSVGTVEMNPRDEWNWPSGMYRGASIEIDGTKYTIMFMFGGGTWGLRAIFME